MTDSNKTNRESRTKQMLLSPKRPKTRRPKSDSLTH